MKTQMIKTTEIKKGDILTEHGLVVQAVKLLTEKPCFHGRVVVGWECKVLEDNNPKDYPLPSWAFMSQKEYPHNYDRSRYYIQGNDNARSYLVTER